MLVSRLEVAVNLEDAQSPAKGDWLTIRHHLGPMEGRQGDIGARCLEIKLKEKGRALAMKKKLCSLKAKISVTQKPKQYLLTLKNTISVHCEFRIIHRRVSMLIKQLNSSRCLDIV